MKLPRLLVLSVALPVLMTITAPTHAAVPLADDELAQVHAAGLPDAALRDSALATLPGADMAAAREWSSATDQQQALAHARFASGTAQASVGLMRSATLPALFTPLAPLFLPALAMPFPFLMAPPPKKH
jgi:hypothetical protein